MKIISNLFIFIGLLILVLTFERPGQVAGVQTEAGGVAGGSGEVSILPVEEMPLEEEGELGGGISTEEGEVQGEAIEKASRLPLVAGGLGFLLIAAAGYFYWKRNKA